MQKCTLFLCLLLASAVAAQTSSPNSVTETNLPAASAQTTAPVPAVQTTAPTPAVKPTISILPEAVIFPNGQRCYLDATLTDTNIKGTDVNSEGHFKGQGHDRGDTIEQGAGTAGGMLVGGLVGGPVGILIGGAIGAGATTTHWLVKHRSATLPAGTQLTLELNRPMSLTTTSASNTGGSGGGR